MKNAIKKIEDVLDSEYPHEPISSLLTDIIKYCELIGVDFEQSLSHARERNFRESPFIYLGESDAL